MIAEQATLGVHVAAGIVALIAGAAAIVTRKGGRRHRRAGRTFVYAMAVLAGTAIALLGFERSTDRQFLSLVGVFSVYFAFSGYRALRRRAVDTGRTAVDWDALTCMGVASAGILVYGLGFWFDGVPFAPVLIVFGAIGVSVTAMDGLIVAGWRTAGTWLGEHVFRMGAAYVATLTAVSSVNFTGLPLVVRWLWPTVVGVPAIAWAIGHYETRFGLR